MLCDRCKMKEAKIFYTEIVDGKKREQRLCEDCAAELTSFNKDLSLGSILSGLLASAGIGPETAGGKANGDAPGSDVQCPTCGMSYPVFRHVGKFGCADCYQAFRPFLQGNIKRIQGAMEHTGKVSASWQETEPETLAAEPAAAEPELRADEAETAAAELEPMEPTLEQMEHDLKAAILAEEYEEAARLRDAIRERRASAGERGGAEHVG